jgi:cytochrome c biogenesis protein
MQTRPAGHADELRVEPAGSDLPRLGWRGTLRFVWTQLTSMRTALVLLFALAVAAIPGSLIPQRRISPIRVDDFIAAHPTLGPLYDKVGLFAVYSSPWFSAVYLLLFVSLIGCIVPRVRVYARALRAEPPKTPRNLQRLPAYATAEVVDPGTEAPDVLVRAAAELRRQHYRVRVEDDGSVAAERGYLREAGNLVFHVSLLFLLLGVAVGALWGYRGSSVVIVGQGFSNSVTQYDDLTAGAWFRATSLKPFNVIVKDFDVKFETGPVQTGAARLFRADLGVTEAPGEPTKPVVLEVNHPLHVDGSTVHLIGHGYAPVVTVKDGQGNVAFSGPVVFLPQDGNFTSAGVVKVPDARPERLALQGFFLPSAVSAGPGMAPTSAFPDALNPALFVNVWSGPPAPETGKPENIYSLDTTGLTQVKGDDGAPLRVALQPGQGVTLPNGLGSIRLDGWNRWVKLQVGDSPGAPVALGSIAFAVFGLCLSLFIRPRRVWVRLAARTNGDEGPTVVEVGGLDRADARGGLTDDVDDLVTHLTTAGRQGKKEASTT